MKGQNILMANPALQKESRGSELGKRLREIRKTAQVSISELSQKAGVSNGMISQIERGLTNPSIKVLERLHIALSVPLTALLEDSKPEPTTSDKEVVRRVADRPYIKVGNQGMTKELLTPRGDHHIQMMIIHLPGGAHSSDVLLGQGEKAGWVLDGSIKLNVGGEISLLAEGDSFQFSSDTPHSILNPGKEEARLLWIMRVAPVEMHL